MFLKKLIKEFLYLMHDVSFVLLLFLKHIFSLHFRNDLKFEKKDKPIYILGNGPSLQLISQSITDRCSIEVCTVNYSLTTSLFFEIKPEMHVIADPVVYNLGLKENLEFYDCLRKVDWDLLLVMVYKIPDEVLNIIYENKKVKVVYFPRFYIDLKSYLGMKIENLLYKYSWTMPEPMNVMVACIYCSMNQGYKNIYLYGVDHSWMRFVSVNMNNQVCLEDQHYYGTTQRVWERSDGQSFTMCELYYTQYILYRSYTKLKKYMRYLGDVKIINKTPGSFIDVFEKQE